MRRRGTRGKADFGNPHSSPPGPPSAALDKAGPGAPLATGQHELAPPGTRVAGLPLAAVGPISGTWCRVRVPARSPSPVSADPPTMPRAHFLARPKRHPLDPSPASWSVRGGRNTVLLKSGLCCSLATCRRNRNRTAKLTATFPFLPLDSLSWKAQRGKRGISWIVCTGSSWCWLWAARCWAA
jgi:hypothetical protein